MIVTTARRTRRRALDRASPENTGVVTTAQGVSGGNVGIEQSVGDYLSFSTRMTNWIDCFSKDVAPLEADESQVRLLLAPHIR